ncbi:MAG: hypothetical protein CR991_08630 [Proteobacteria bacterium]|nr:MAG: hypothetical protein CR991_08630 [Pseudomonadota bacterium]
MDNNKSTTKRMIGAVVLVLIAALLLAWLLKGKNRSEMQREMVTEQTTQGATPIIGFPPLETGENMQTEELAIGLDATNAGDATQQQNGEGAGGVGAAVSGAVSSAVDAGKEAVQDLGAKMDANSISGFEIRDPKADEVRQVVVRGQVEPGVGSMGAETTAAANAQAGDTASTQPAQNNQAGNTAAAQTGQNSAQAGATFAATTAANNDRAVASRNDEVQPARTRTVPRPRLVNERPVPPPSSQARRGARPRPVATHAARPATKTKTASSRKRTASAPVSSSTGGSGYVIQLVATSSRSRAEGVRRSLAVEGYPVFVAQAQIDGKRIYRVRVGSYPSRSDANSVQRRMKSRYQQNQYVQSSFVTKN